MSEGRDYSSHRAVRGVNRSEINGTGGERRDIYRAMASDPPPPYPGGPTAPLLEDKHGSPSNEDNRQPPGAYPPSMAFVPPDSGPPPYDATPGYIPPNPGYFPSPGPYAPMGYYPPSAGQYPPQFPSPGGHGTTVIVPPGASSASTTTTVTVLQGEIFQGSPVQTVCPHCQQPILTKITHEIGLMNFLLCCFCCFVGCDLGCCLIPCMINDLKDVTHTCPNCKAYIYTYRRMG